MRSLLKKIWRVVTHVQIVIVFLAFALMVSFSSLFMGDILRMHLASNAQAVLDSLENNIRVDLLEPRTVLGNLCQTACSMILEGDNAVMLSNYLKRITNYILLDNDRQLSGFSGIYGYFDVFGGLLIDGFDRVPPETYEPKERPWYREAVAAGGNIVFLPPYTDAATTSIIITYARALYDDMGQLLGVIALDLRLERISEYILNANLGTMGYGFLLGEQMEFLAYTNPDFFGKKFGDVNSDYAVLENQLKKKHVITEYRMKNFVEDPSVFFIRQLENGWYIGVVTPEGIYYRELKKMRIILSILGIMLASGLSAILLNIIEARRKAEERTRIMFDATPLGATLWDRNCKNIDCNQETLKLFEISSKQEYLDRFNEFSPEYQPDGMLSGEKVVEYIKKAFDEGYCCFEWMHQKVNGEPIPCQVTLVRVGYENDFVVAGYTYDLRELKTTIAQMNESKRSLTILKNILNGLNTMIYVTVPNSGEILFMNDHMKEHFNIDDECVGKPCYKVLQNGLDGICDFCPCHQLNRDPGKIIEWEERSTLTKRIYSNTDWYMEWHDGRIAHVQHSIDETELISAKELAEQSSHYKSQFLSRMSHEVRTPMNAILGITEIQLQNEALPQEIQAALNKINTSGYLLLGIINDILDLSKIEAGKLELVPIAYDVPSLINDTVHLNIMRYDSKLIEFNLHVDENVPSMLFGDELRIKQILTNLLSNAFKYTNEGEVSMSVSAEYSKQGESHQVMLVFRIADTGQGMTSDQVDKLYDEFLRFNMEANRTTEGTGLGMNITRNLVQMMKGEILVESKPGEGSVFTVRLPQGIVGSGVLGREVTENLKQFRVGGQAQMKKVPQITRDYMPYGRVLIVDDVETNLYVAKGLMAPYGLSLETATSGFEVVDKIKNGATFDIIFMDHFMPKMDGMEATKIIRGLGYADPIIALTANALVGQEEMFMENGFDGFISKPIDIRQLNASLNKLIRDKYPPEVVEAARRQKAAIKKPLVVEAPPLSDTELKSVFVRDAEKAFARILAVQANEFHRKDDIRQFVIDTHSMKSALANIGETEISAAALELEQAGRAEDLSIIESKTPEFLEALRKVIDKNKLKEDDVDTVQENSSEDLAYLNEKLLVIQKACEEYDEMTANATLTELKQKKWPQPARELLNNIAEHLLHSDFEEAANAAKEYAKNHN